MTPLFARVVSGTVTLGLRRERQKVASPKLRLYSTMVFALLLVKYDAMASRSREPGGGKHRRAGA